MIAAVVAMLLASSTPALERRCGWIDNPTPGNWWITDRTREWTMMEQGGYEAAGMDVVPDLTTGQWVVTNVGSYGYGCACVTGRFDRRSARVRRLTRVTPLPLARCRRDRALKQR